MARRGIEVAMEWLEALLAGGIAFDTPDMEQPGAPAAEHRRA
jgi:paraquat-inducible protein B